MLKKPTYRFLHATEVELIESKGIDWSITTGNTTLQWKAFADELGRRFLMLQNGAGDVRFWCSVKELRASSPGEISSHITGEDRNRENLPMYFTGHPDILKLILEVDVCEVPWLNEWMIQMALRSEGEFFTYFREHIQPTLSETHRKRIGTRLQEVFNAFQVYRQATEGTE